MTEETTWLPATTSFIEADVVRWTENIWSDKKQGRGKKAKHILLGKQQVTGQITNIDDEFVHIKVIEATLIEKVGASDRNLRKAGDIIRKKPKSLVNAGLERLLWSDEKSRADIITEKNSK